jgi:hypothetical protein
MILMLCSNSDLLYINHSVRVIIYVTEVMHLLELISPTLHKKGVLSSGI